MKEIEAAGGKDEYQLNKYSTDGAKKLKSATFDVDALAARGHGYEELDQLVNELILGIRGDASFLKEESLVGATARK